MNSKRGQIQCEMHIISFQQESGLKLLSSLAPIIFYVGVPHEDFIRWTTMVFMAELNTETSSTFLPLCSLNGHVLMLQLQFLCS